MNFSFYLSSYPEARKIAAQIEREVMNRLKSGPLNYDVYGRLVYHLSEELKRDTSLRIHDEMLTASDEYNAVRVEGEASKVSTDRLKITLNCAANQLPVVMPRKTFVHNASTGKKDTVYRNDIVVKLAGSVVPSKEYVVNYEAGEITFNSALPAGAVQVSYSYATNVTVFKLTPDAGVSRERHLNKLISLVGRQKAVIGKERFERPNFLLMTETVANELSDAEQYATMFARNGSALTAEGYLATVKGLNAYEHNEPWRVGDSRILMGVRNASKYGIGTSMQLDGPHPTRDGDGNLTGGQELYYFLDDATLTPKNQGYHTIKLVP